MLKYPLPSVSARLDFLEVIDNPLFENLGVIGKFRGSELCLCKLTFYLSAHASILKVLEECPYLKIMVVSKFGACFTIGRLVADGFCYIHGNNAILCCL